MLCGKQVFKGLLQPLVPGITQMAQNIGSIDRMAGIDCPLRGQFEPPVLTPRAENEVGDFLQHRIAGIHAQFKQQQGTAKGGKRAALAEPLVRGSPQITALIMTSCQDGVCIRLILLTYSYILCALPSCFCQQYSTFPFVIPFPICALSAYSVHCFHGKMKSPPVGCSLR